MLPIHLTRNQQLEQEVHSATHQPNLKDSSSSTLDHANLSPDQVRIGQNAEQDDYAKFIAEVPHNASVVASPNETLDGISVLHRDRIYEIAPENYQAQVAVQYINPQNVPTSGLHVRMKRDNEGNIAIARPQDQADTSAIWGWVPSYENLEQELAMRTRSQLFKNSFTLRVADLKNVHTEILTILPEWNAEDHKLLQIELHPHKFNVAAFSLGNIENGYYQSHMHKKLLSIAPGSSSHLGQEIGRIHRLVNDALFSDAIKQKFEVLTPQERANTQTEMLKEYDKRFSLETAKLEQRPRLSLTTIGYGTAAACMLTAMRHFPRSMTAEVSLKDFAHVMIPLMAVYGHHVLAPHFRPPAYETSPEFIAARAVSKMFL